MSSKVKNLVGVREFARRVGKSHVWILKRIKAGDIQVQNGKIDFEAGMKSLESRIGTETPLQKIWTEEQKRKGSRKAALERISPSRGKTSGSRVDERHPEVVDLMNEMAETKSSQELQRELLEAKIKQIRQQTRLDEIEEEETLKELLRAEDVIAANARIASTVRARLLALPSRIAPQAVGFTESRQLERLLEDLVNEILVEFHDLCKERDRILSESRLDLEDEKSE